MDTKAKSTKSSKTEETSDFKDTDVREGKYLTFGIDGETYGIYIMNVVEIVGLVDMTRVPRTPDYVKGVINLRGKVIPVLDLKKRFNAGFVSETGRTPIIIVEVKSGEKKSYIGLLVDHVSDVMIVTKDNLEPLPSFGIELNTEFIAGLARFDDEVITLLDIDQILTSTEMIDIRKVKQQMVAAVEK